MSCGKNDESCSQNFGKLMKITNYAERAMDLQNEQ